MSSTWGRLASEALPTGCSWHDQATSERRGGRRRRSARQRGLARYLGPGIAICLATPRKLWARRMAGRGGLAGYTELCESIAQFKIDSVSQTRLGSSVMFATQAEAKRFFV